MQLQLRTLAGAPARVRLSLAGPLTGDDGATPATSSLAWPQLTRHGQALRVGLPPGSALAGRFPRRPSGSAWATARSAPGRDDALLLPRRHRRHLQPRPLPGPAASPVHDELRRAHPETPGCPRQPGQAPPPCFSGPAAPQIAVVADMLPWFQHNALVHRLSPRGLEQYSGGGWGSRDVCQGQSRCCWPWRDRAKARPAAPSAPRTPTATGRSGSCSSSATRHCAPGTRTATSSLARVRAGPLTRLPAAMPACWTSCRPSTTTPRAAS